MDRSQLLNVILTARDRIFIICKIFIWSYNVRDSSYQKFDIDFKDNYYFYAIPNKHLETNAKLKQTMGWDNGTFNPHE